MSPGPASLDLDGFHRLLWLRREGTGIVRVKQQDYARELRTSKYAICRSLARMEDQGRLERLNSSGGSASGVYEVMDPDQWQP